MLNQKSQLYDQIEAEFPILPGKMQRGELEGLLIDVSNFIGMSGSLLRSLLTMMRETRPSDWTNREVEPVCFAMQTNIAASLGKSDRALRMDEASLVALGFIDKQVAANGSRCRLTFADGSEFRQGLSFTPLIEKVADLAALREQMRYERQHNTRLRRSCSALRRNIRRILMDVHPLHPEHPGLCAVAETFLSWPTRYSEFRTIDALEDHYAEALATFEAVDEIRLLLQNNSGQAEVSFLPYIQDTTEEPYVYCNASVEKRTAANATDSNYSNAEPNGSANCLERSEEKSRSGDNSEFLAKLTPKRLFWLASAEMQTYITYHQGSRHDPSTMDFVLAAIDRLPDLGINKSAYHAAIDVMEDFQVALCILIIDSNRDHPVTPVKNPGGLLRSLTRKHTQGQLNLTGSLIGLSERRKSE